jgi:hypothetical protein
MESLLEQLNQLLREHFAGAETDLEIVNPGDKISGYLVWSGFLGQEQLKRQQQLWKVLRRHLSKDQREKISLILTMTPQEMLVSREG